MGSQSEDAPTTAAPGRRRIVISLVALAFAAYAAFLAWFMGAHAGGSDGSGYMNNAKLMAEGRAHLEQRALPGLPPGSLPAFAYVPLGFRPTDDGRMYPTYPTGLPLMIAAMSAIAGWDGAAPWTIGLHALAGIALVYALGRELGLRRDWSLLGALILAVSPLYIFLSLQTLSDMPALVWATAAVWLAWRSAARGSVALPLAAGAAFAMAVLVRPTNFLAIAPVAIALGLDWRRWLTFGLGGLPGAIFLALFNRSAYGAVFASGYDGLGQFIKLEFAGVTLAHYALWLPVLLTPIGLLALGLPWLARERARIVLVLGAWVVAIAGFYTFYQFTHETWWYLRFVLPAFPAFIVAALLVAQRLADRFVAASRAWICSAVLTAVAIAFSVPWTYKLHAYAIGRGEAVYREAADWTIENVPANAVIVTMQVSGAFIFYTDFAIVRWDWMQPGVTARIEKALEGSGRPLYAVLFPFEEDSVLNERMPGGWEKVGNVRHITMWRRVSGISTQTP